MPKTNWAPWSEFVSSSIPSLQVLTAHAQPFRGARDLAFCLKVLLDSLLVWASSGGSGETAWMRRLAWTFAARLGNKYQICLTRPNCLFFLFSGKCWFKIDGCLYYISLEDENFYVVLQYGEFLKLQYGEFLKFQIQYTVKPVFRDHPGDSWKVFS